MNKIEWNNQHEALLKKITKQCDILSEIHRYASRYYERRNKIFGTPLIVLGAVTTTSIFSQSEYQYMFYISGSLSLLTTILSAVGDWLGYKTKMVKHGDASISYEEISLEVNEQITFNRENRRQIDEYMKYVRDTFIKLKKNSQPISIGIYDKFTNSFDHFIKKMKKLDGTEEIKKEDVYVQTSKIFGDLEDPENLREISNFVANERERDRRREKEWEEQNKRNKFLKEVSITPISSSSYLQTPTYLQTPSSSYKTHPYGKRDGENDLANKVEIIITDDNLSDDSNNPHGGKMVLKSIKPSKNRRIRKKKVQKRVKNKVQNKVKNKEQNKVIRNKNKSSKKTQSFEPEFKKKRLKKNIPMTSATNVVSVENNKGLNMVSLSGEVETLISNDITNSIMDKI